MIAADPAPKYSAAATSSCGHATCSIGQKFTPQSVADPPYRPRRGDISAGKMSVAVLSETS